MHRVRLDRSMILVVLTLASSGCDNRYNAVIDGDYLCLATVTSTTCGPDLPDSESVVSVTAGANLSTDPLGLPSPLDPSTNPGSSIQFGPQDDGYTYHSAGFRGCEDGPGYDYELLAILSAFGEDWFSLRYIEDFTGATSCGFADVSADPCRAERRVRCELVR